MSIEQVLAVGTASALSAAKLAAVALGGLVRAVRHRSELEHVAALDPAQLRDIGLLPGDVASARHLPLTRDPTAELARRATANGHL